jgi:hypothetical protein
MVVYERTDTFWHLKLEAAVHSFLFLVTPQFAASRMSAKAEKIAVLKNTYASRNSRSARQARPASGIKWYGRRRKCCLFLVGQRWKVKISDDAFGLTLEAQP